MSICILHVIVHYVFIIVDSIVFLFVMWVRKQNYVISGVKFTFLCAPKMSHNSVSVDEFDLVFKRVDLEWKKKTCAYINKKRPHRFKFSALGQMYWGKIASLICSSFRVVCEDNHLWENRWEALLLLFIGLKQM